MTTRELEKAFIVDTLHRGVFFGYAKPTTKKVVKLRDARMVVFWDISQHGNVGLATSTDLSQCRISPPAPSMMLQDVTAMIEVSKESEQEWLKPHWAK